MKVIATDVSKRYNLRLKELHRVAQPGEIFEVSDERFVYLNGNNPRGYVVVEWYQEPEEVKVEEVVEEPVVIKTPVVDEPDVVEVKTPIIDEPDVVEEESASDFVCDCGIPMEEEPATVEAPVEEEKPKKIRKKKTEESIEEAPVEEKPKKTRKKKAE